MPSFSNIGANKFLCGLCLIVTWGLSVPLVVILTTENMVIFIGGKFRDCVTKILHVVAIFMIWANMLWSILVSWFYFPVAEILVINANCKNKIGNFPPNENSTFTVLKLLQAHTCCVLQSFWYFSLESFQLLDKFIILFPKWARPVKVSCHCTLSVTGCTTHLMCHNLHPFHWLLC